MERTLNKKLSHPFYLTTPSRLIYVFNSYLPVELNSYSVTDNRGQPLFHDKKVPSSLQVCFYGSELCPNLSPNFNSQVTVRTKCQTTDN